MSDIRSEMKTPSPSFDFLDLAERSQQELSAALNSLGGQQSEGLASNFRLYCARHIYRSADGFIALRRTGRNYSARLLIRPAMESMFKLLAVEVDPEVLYRIARYEHEQDKKWARPFVPTSGSSFDSEFEKKWDEFSAAYATQYPDHTRNSSPIDLRSLADKAKAGKYYDSHYRLYCQYTHAALRATTGGLEDFDAEDARSICLPLIVAIQAIIKVGGASPNGAALFEELKQNQ